MSPAKSNLEETISTLDYAFRAKNIKNKPQVNSMISKKTLLKEFTAEIEKLKTELIATRQRNGVYLTAEGYDEIMEQSESRRILSEEQRERIETMEVNLRNKVQDLFTLTNTFAVLKKDFETSRLSLEETRGVLAKTEIVLADTRRTLAEETLIRKAHQTTEDQLLAAGEELHSALDQTTMDLERLHSNVERKSDLESANIHAWGKHQAQVIDTTALVQKRVDDFQSQQQRLLDAMSDRMQSFVRSELTAIGSKEVVMQARHVAFQESDREVVAQVSKTKDELNSVLEEIKTLREEVKHDVGEGLNGLSVAAGRISAEVIKELEGFHSQVSLRFS